MQEAQVQAGGCFEYQFGRQDMPLAPLMERVRAKA